MYGFARGYLVFFLLVHGLFYAWLTWLFITDAPTWFARLQIELDSAVGYTELYALYRGYMAAVSVFFLSALVVDKLVPGVTWFAFLTAFGLVLVRGWRIFREDVYNDLMLQLFMVECLGLAAAIIALYCLYWISIRRRNPYI
ncbi:MAG: hypothetical protein WDZ76_00030 [Pseudohongiellaceae bacterium]